MDKIRVYVVAGANRGKTTIAAIIKEALEAKGFADVHLIDLPQSSEDKEPITRRFEAAKLRRVEIQVALVPNEICERCKIHPVAYPGARFCGAACSQLSEIGA